VKTKGVRKIIQLAKRIARDHRPTAEGYCLACPEEDWGHRDFGPALGPCEKYQLAVELLKK